MTKIPHHLIYVPGILDDIYHAQGALLAAWRLHGVRGHIHPMPWAGQEDYRPKVDRLLAEIDRYIARGHLVSLVGASAGASAILNAYVERADKITSLVYICGKINGPETVSDKTYRANPAFKTSAQLLQSNVARLTDKDTSKMLSLYSPGDHSVPHAATIIPGVPEQQLPALGHGKAIIYSLSIGAPTIINHTKQIAAQAL